MNKLAVKSSQSKAILTYGIAFVVLFFLCMLFPYSGDDWDWGSEMGYNLLLNGFDNYNGRYLSNLIVIALTRSNLLKSAVMSFCLTGIVFLLNRLTGRQKNGIFIISSVLLFMPAALLCESVAWTSGFTNYTISIFLTLIYIYYVNSIYDEKEPKNSFAAAIPLLVLGFANTLIVEHLTLYNVILAIYVIALTKIKFKKVYIQHIAYFIGTIAGTALMFSNSAYRSVVNGSDDYRSIGGRNGIVSYIFHAFFDMIAPEGFFNNIVLNLVLVGVCVIIWFSVKDKLQKLPKILGTLSIIVMIAYVASTIIVYLIGVKVDFTLKFIRSTATIAYLYAFIVFFFILPIENSRRLKLFFILGSTGCMIAPLFVVSPIGSRCFFAPYVMMLYLAMEIYSLFNDNIKEKCAKISRIAIITTIGGLIYLFCIYGTIAHCNNERIEYVLKEAQSGADVIYIEQLPYSEYVWNSDLDVFGDIVEDKFKKYYDIDKNVKIEMLP